MMLAQIANFSLSYLALIPLCPFIAALIIFACKEVDGQKAIRVAIAALGISCFFGLYAFTRSLGSDGKVEVLNFDWISLGVTSVSFGFVLNSLTGAMAAMVVFVGMVIFLYSAEYMKDDPRVGMFFCYLSLFMSGMLGLVVANSLLLLFMSWEIVGLASYLLIGFWYHKPSAAAAAKKAFITTRIGDLGFLLGLVWAYKSTGTLLLYDNGHGILETSQVELLAGMPGMCGLTAAGSISLLLFIGAVGKSGQLPLHVWLPDAMEGPTPVSALIHAATMVAAGVFLVARTFSLFLIDSEVLHLVGWIGALTALFAAFVALGQYDLKRILAYSTVSQLGLMMVGLGMGGLALGPGGVGVGMFHLLTHAFFKALLFLGAGSIIHGCGNEQDIRKMGGVFKEMPTTSWLYLMGAAALCALPLSSGFFSKEEILMVALHESKAVFWISVLASMLTCLYMTRQCCYVFIGSYRGAGHLHESSKNLLTPLMPLGFFALCFGGFAKTIGIVDYLSGGHYHVSHELGVTLNVFGVSLTIVVAGLGLGYLLYGRRGVKLDGPDVLDACTLGLYRVLERKFYVDELYQVTLIALWTRLSHGFVTLEELLRFVIGEVLRIVGRVADFFAWVCDRKWIDKCFFDGTCRSVRSAGTTTSKMQTGFLQDYLRVLVCGVVVLCILFWVFKR